MSSVTELLIVAALGALGALLRWGLLSLVVLWKQLPQLSTVVANTLGSLLAGWALAADWGVWSWLIAVALAGSMTTLSTLAVDVAGALRSSPKKALLLLSGHMVGGFLGFAVGFLGLGALG